MSARTPPSEGDGPAPEDGTARGEHPAGSRARRRDAEATRALLVDAARRRFAHDGYQATTVRGVAADAGVNAALVNRYFTSKEGLFEACMPRSLDLFLGRPDADLQQALQRLVHRICSSSPDDERLRLPLLLLLRSSGDERADQIRRTTLQSFAEDLAAAAGWRVDDPAAQDLVLHAQVAVGVLLGTLLLRSSVALEPLASADTAQLSRPLGAAITALIDPTP